MNGKNPVNRSRRSSSAGRKTSQFDAAKARSKRPMAQKSKGGREDPLAGQRGRRVHQGAKVGTVRAVYVRRLHDLETGRTWDRVFLFDVNAPEDFEAAEAWLDEHYPLSEEDDR